MKRKIFFLSISLLIILLLGYFYFIKNYSFFDYGDAKNEDNRVLIDSLKLSKDQTVYWFKYEGGLSSNPQSFITISSNVCSISDKNALIKGEFIKGIDTIKNDSIFIITMDSIITLNSSPQYKFVKRDFSYDKEYPRKNVAKEIYIREICNNKN